MSADIHDLIKADMDRAVAELRQRLIEQMYAPGLFDHLPRRPPMPWWKLRLWWPLRSYVYGWGRAFLGCWQALCGQPVLESDEWDY